LTIHFDASTSTDPQNLPLTYSWAFGDGSTATGAIVAGTFKNAGTYSATVAVGDGHNTTTSSPIVITVTPASTNPVPDARNSSTLFYVSPAVNPGRTILFQGQYLGAASQATVVRLADSANPDPSTASFNFPTGADLTNGVLLPIIQASNTSAKLTLSSELNPGVYAVQFQSSTNAGSQIAPSSIHAVINLPQVQWWMGRSTVPGSTGSAAYAGQEVDIFGRNFGSSPSVWISNNGTFTPISVLQSNPYRVRLTLPSTIAAGSYQIWVHNGYGGQYGFAAPVALTVSPAPTPWSKTQFNVMTFGAKGDGSADDTAAIVSALKAAGDSTQNGGIIYFPAGTYLVSSKLSLPANTIVQGAGASSTRIITATVPKSTGKFQALFAGNAHFIIQDLSISTDAADFLITCPDVPGMYNDWGVVQPLGAACQDVTLQRLTISHTTLQKLQANGEYRGSRTLNFLGSDVRILDSTVSTKNVIAMSLTNPKNSIITGNVFLNGSASYLQLVESQRTIFENNEVSALDADGNCVNNQNQIDYFYVADNYIHDCNGGYGEGFSADTPYFPYRLGRPASINATDGSFTYSDPLIDPNPHVPAGSQIDLSNGYIGVVVGGTGIGQMKRIVANTYTKVSVESPWQVSLDATSVLDLQVDKSQNVFYQNRFLNTSVTVQLYSQAYENVVDGNKGTNTGGSYCVGNDLPAQASGTGPVMRRFEYCYYNEWVNNVLSGNLPDSNIDRDYQLAYPNAFLGETGSARAFTGVDSAIMPLDPVVMFIGNSVRDNQLQTNNTLGFVYDNGWTHPSVMPPSRDSIMSQDFLVEGNEIQSCQPASGSARSSPVGIDIYPGAFDSLLGNNQVSDCLTPVWNSAQP
jgi:hypothetical protein